MNKAITLRTRLMISFIAAAVIPLVIAAWVAVPWFQGSIEDEAQRALSLHASVATEIFAEEKADRAAQAVVVATDLAQDNQYRQADLGMVLTRQVITASLDHMLFLDSAGKVTAASSGSAGREYTWPQIAEVLKSTEATSVLTIVPASEVEEMQAVRRSSVPLKETEGDRKSVV